MISSEINTRRRPWSRYLQVTGWALLIAAVLFAALWVRVLNALGIDDWLERKFIQYTVSATANELAREVEIIVIDAADNGETLPGYNPDANEVEAWRAHHARIIEKLAEAGASVIAFDLYFASPSNSFIDANEALVDAVRETTSNTNTTIITGFRPGDLSNAPLESVLPRVAMGRIDLQETTANILGEDYTTRVLLAEKLVARDSSGNVLESIIRPLPMPLAIYIASQRESRGAARIELFPFSNKLEINWERGPPTDITVEILRCAAGESGCGAIDGGAVSGEATIYRALLPFWIRRSADVIPYQRVLEAADVSELFAGKVALIGARVARELVTLGPGAPDDMVYGYEVQARVVSDLLRSSYPHRLHEVVQFFLLTLTVVLGYAARTRLPIKAVMVPWGPLNGRPLPLGLFVVGVILLVVAFLLFRASSLLFDLAYYLIALVVGYYFLPGRPGVGQEAADIGGDE